MKEKYGKGWSPERVKRMMETRAAKKEADPNYGKHRKRKGVVVITNDIAADTRIMDAINFLRHARAHVDNGLREGKLKRRDKAHTLADLALMTLEGE